ncbi:diguanylate cyclase domain-containing protein [Nocardioides pelophilus]|uniref:diguanylate cyclase domain-containing protein n=1 Tax=Nocardioides pelophilus TaxID=2172019 RepID=UPI001C8142A9|nr:diguanylate cyclase [Nocardioides pelophilus]
MIQRVLREATPPIAFAFAFAASIMLGRATRVAGSEISLVWPAAAVAVLWLLFMAEKSRVDLIANGVLLAGLTFGINLVTGAAVDLSAWFLMVNMTLVAVTLGVLRTSGRRVVLRDPADLGRLIVAVSAGSLSAAALAMGWFWLNGTGHLLSTFGLFAVRNGVTAFVGVAVALILREATWTAPRFTPARTTELVTTSIAVVLIFGAVFWINQGTPLAFLALVPAVWISLRYSTTTATIFVITAGVAIVWATLQERGVFYDEAPHIRALLAQAMVGSLTLVVLALALFRDSRNQLIAELEDVHEQLREDIAARRRVEAELQRLALHDPLTGLANRTLLLLRAEVALDLARSDGSCVGLMFIDLDGFKQVNDDWGHVEGDAVLREVARRLGSVVRGEFDTVARLGGDEFAVLCPDLTDTKDLQGLTERIRTRLAAPYRTMTGHPINHVSASIGVALSDPESTASGLLDHADRLMYAVKRAGRSGLSTGTTAGR